jgi:hypothetical protein
MTERRPRLNLGFFNLGAIGLPLFFEDTRGFLDTGMTVIEEQMQVNGQSMSMIEHFGREPMMECRTKLSFEAIHVIKFIEMLWIALPVEKTPLSLWVVC